MRLSELGEADFLRELGARFTDHPDVPIGIGDDAAAIRMPDGESVLVTVDSLVEGTHFLPSTTPPRFVGRKSVAVSASDIAAMGGRARAAVMSLIAPPEIELASVWEVIDGAAEKCEELGMALVGGNMARSPAGLIVDVTVLGHTVDGRTLKRRGAAVGESSYVSGTLGRSACGLKLLQAGATLSASNGLVAPAHLRSGPLELAPECIRAHLDPEPRLALGVELSARELATACIDLSDGLSIDLVRLCEASGVGARIHESFLPLAPGLVAWEREWERDPVELGLNGGEDYELLFTSTPPLGGGQEAIASVVGVPLTLIGEVVAREPGAPVVSWVRDDGSVEPLETTGWDHFTRE